ncbi:MAG: hypothetical protein ACLUOI_28780 [Eisenbergiella sp.]
MYLLKNLEMGSWAPRWMCCWKNPFKDNPLLMYEENLILTPHVAWYAGSG